jgi:hypothetical protein
VPRLTNQMLIFFFCILSALVRWSTGARAPRLLGCGRQGRSGFRRGATWSFGGSRSSMFILFMFKVFIFLMNLYNEYVLWEKSYTLDMLAVALWTALKSRVHSIVRVAPKTADP